MNRFETFLWYLWVIITALIALGAAAVLILGWITGELPVELRIVFLVVVLGLGCLFWFGRGHFK